MNIRQIVVGSFQANCFVVWSNTGSAIVIDPGSDPERIEQVLDENNLSVAAYTLTHGHMDHVSAVAALYAVRPAPVGISGPDLTWAFTAENEMAPFYSTPTRPGKVERELADGQEWTDAGLTYRVIATPGHTPGCVCFHFPAENALFTGDTLFAGSVGRTDLHGGDARLLRESLTKLTALPDDTIVYCGHGPETTILEEKTGNFFLRRTGG